MSTPDSPTPKWHRITPENQPVFPCWLWHPIAHYAARFHAKPSLTIAPEYWHPDQPTAPTSGPTEHPCTCHPDDNPPVPCNHKYALNECKAAPAGTPTPRTDEAEAWRYSAYTVPADFARTLETELASSNAQLRDMTDQFFKVSAEVAEAKAERDRLDAELERMCGQPGSFAERDRLRRELTELRTERDNYKRSVQNAHTALDKCGLIQGLDKSHKGLTNRVCSVVTRSAAQLTARDGCIAQLRSDIDTLRGMLEQACQNCGSMSNEQLAAARAHLATKETRT